MQSSFKYAPNCVTLLSKTHLTVHIIQKQKIMYFLNLIHRSKDAGEGVAVEFAGVIIPLCHQSHDIFSVIILGLEMLV